jgi:hypothetical protein
MSKLKKIEAGAVKANGTPYSEAEIQQNNELVDILDPILAEANKDLMAGLITKEQAVAITNEAVAKAIETLNATNKTNADDLAKAWKAIARQGEALTLIGNSQLTSKELRKSILAEFDERADEFKAWLETKSIGGSFRLTVNKAPSVHTVAGTNQLQATGGTEILESYRMVDGFVVNRYPMQFIFDVVDRTTSAFETFPQTLVFDEQGPSEGNFAVTPEGTLKPLMSNKMLRKTSTAQKAAGRMVVTTEFQVFRSRLNSIMKQLFNDQILRDYQNKLMADLFTVCVPYTYTALTGVATPTNYDAIGAMCAQLETLEYMPDTVVVNSLTKWKMLLSKGTDGHTLMTIVPVVGANGQLQLMGLRTIVSNKLSGDDVIVCESGQFKVEDSTVDVRVGFGVQMNGAVAESDFDYNRNTIIAELFYHAYLPANRSASYVKASLATVKLAIV